MRRHTWLGLVLLATVSAAWAELPPDAVAPQKHYAEIARRLASHLPRQHLTHNPFGNVISARSWTNYLEVLDFDRSYFVGSDIARWSEQTESLDEALTAGDLEFAYDVFHVFKQRMRDRVAYTEKLLADGFDLERDEAFFWRRRHQPWPADEAAWNEVWRQRIKNEYIREQVSRTLEEEKREEEAKRNAESPDPAVPVGTNLVTTADAEEEKPPPSIEEAILERYRQMLTVFEDSDSEWVLQRYLSAVARAYDPHSDYMSPSTVEDFNIEMKLSLTGIGALLRPEDGTAKIVRLIPGGPADQDKRDIRLQPGDKIIGVGQGDDPLVDVSHWPLYKAVKIIRGPKGSKVVLKVISASDPSGATTRKVDLVRDEVKLEDQAAKWRVEDVDPGDGNPLKLGVINLPTFYANMRVTSRRSPDYRSSAQDIDDLLTKADEEGVSGIVLDLRNNGGGALLEAVRMTGLFIKTGPTVQVKESYRLYPLEDRDPRVSFRGPLVILVNRLSASASEILAAALQDYGRAVVVGDSRTHGKGTVQAIRPLGLDERMGSAKTTSSMFYRITGDSTQLRGVTPDIVISSPYEYLELGEDTLANPMPWDTVGRADYDPVADLRTIVAALREKSEDRRANDPRFEVYNRLLQRVRAVNEKKLMPLQLAARLRMAREERELAELQRDLTPDDTDTEGESRRKDLVMDEGLRILADLTRLQGEAPEVADGSDKKKDLSQLLQRLIRERM